MGAIVQSLTRKTAEFMDGIAQLIGNIPPYLTSKDAKTAAEIIKKDLYSLKRDTAIFNLKIGAFNFCSLMLITQVGLLALGSLAVTPELLTSLALVTAIRHVLGFSIDAQLGTEGKMVNLLTTFFGVESPRGGAEALGFFRTFTPLPILNALFRTQD